MIRGLTHGSLRVTLPPQCSHYRIDQTTNTSTLLPKDCLIHSCDYTSRMCLGEMGITFGLDLEQE